MDQELVVRIEPARETNAEILAKISKEAFHTDSELGTSSTLPEPRGPGGPPGYDSPDFQKFIMKIMNYYEILADDKIVGGLFFSSANQDHYVLERIFVSPSYHRKGIATRAMELAFEKHPDAKFWTLGTPSWNLRTKHFYERLGYVQVGWEEAENPAWRGVWYQKTVKPYSLPKIKNLEEGMEFITIEGTIASIGSPRKTTQGNEAKSVTVADAVLKDHTGEINIMIREFQIPYMTPGTKVRVEYALVESYSGKLMLDWKYGRIINLIESSSA
ncbi:MAG: GNAT family N-acetyltransferase [Candidatus Hermodarchaeota archaeon]